MKRMLFLVAMMAVVLAAPASTSSISAALQQMEDQSRTFLLVTSVVEGVIALAGLGGAAFIYFRKVKGAQKKEALWLAGAAILGLVGLLFLAGCVLGLLMYLSTPVLVKSMLAPS